MKEIIHDSLRSWVDAVYTSISIDHMPVLDDNQEKQIYGFIDHEAGERHTITFERMEATVGEAGECDHDLPYDDMARVNLVTTKPEDFIDTELKTIQDLRCKAEKLFRNGFTIHVPNNEVGFDAIRIHHGLSDGYEESFQYRLKKDNP